MRREETVLKRLEVYAAQTRPLVDYYSNWAKADPQNAPKVRKIDGLGTVEEIHILTTTEVTPKQTVRNVESALIAHLGMRVSHKKISVATSDEGHRPPRGPQGPPYATPSVPTPAVATPSHAVATTSVERPRVAHHSA